MYTGKLDLSEHAGSDVLNLILASDELLLDELVTSVQEYLIKNQAEWLQQNLFKVLQIVFQLESCKLLQNYCLVTICDEPDFFFDSPKFPTLEKNVLLRLVERDDLQIDETELWNYLIKWGMAQSSELKGKEINNIRSWDENDFMVLKSTLNQLIAHIRYFEISSKDFHSNIWPLRKLLPEALFEDIVSFYMANIKPDQYNLASRASRHVKVTVDSLIIKLKHASILANWIQRKDYNAKIRNGKDLKNIKISRVKTSDFAIYECSDQNIPFNFGNSDLIINKNSGTSNQRHYESSILDTNNFSIEEMEIFRFIKD
ncbi:17586_t:CDS:2 [Funneliformis geosporum]|uniref:17586_t:CDS:1 n=1 Tax=Funneliformis geosporum TaxID=1117311 RepID=A0A9W4SYZ6_9GLOM|nr:17586_t:CDS:2 [Funneliformis geosporum]